MLIAESADRRVHTVDAGRLMLDGGAMFGVVPKPLWQRRVPADDRNRIPLAMRCLLVDADGKKILVDTGLGNKEGESFMEIHGVENEGRPTKLEDSLRRLGVAPAEIDFVVNTHLHFDHAGGNTFQTSGGEIRPSFENARYVVRRGEWEAARSANLRIQAGYLAHNQDALEQEGRIDLIEEDLELIPGVRLVQTPGHTKYHQSVVVELGGETVCFLADLVPMSPHIRLPWIMAYDLEPLVTLDTKRHWLTRAGAEHWLLVFEHDPVVACARALPLADGDGCGIEEPRDDEDLQGEGD